jgi:hypothetical protein
LAIYAQSFAENDIDFAVLADLTDQDLEKIGVTSLGHRRKLLRAIVDLNRGENEAAKSIGAAGHHIAGNALIAWVHLMASKGRVFAFAPPPLGE